MAKTNTFKKLSTPQKLFRSLDNVRALNILGEAGIKALPVSEFTKVGLRGVFHCIGGLYHYHNIRDDKVRSHRNALGTAGHIGLIAMSALEGTGLLSLQTKTFRFIHNTIRTVGFGLPNALEMLEQGNSFYKKTKEDRVPDLRDITSLTFDALAGLSNLAMLMSPLYTQTARPCLPHIAAITLGLSTAAKWIKDGSEENTDDAQEEVKKHIGISPQGKIDREKQRTTWSNIDPKWYDID